MVAVLVTGSDLDALDACIAEYGFSTEAGGANDGDPEAEAAYDAATKLMSALRHSFSSLR